LERAVVFDWLAAWLVVDLGLALLAAIAVNGAMVRSKGTRSFKTYRILLESGAFRIRDGAQKAD
jgi:UPF0716 family protein affecting phage T7 exclusion